MITTKQVQNFRARMRKDMTSFGCMGAMMLQIEIDQMTQEERVALRDALAASRSPLSYPYLNAAIEKAVRS